MGIVFLILKGAGILLLAIICILVFLLCLILFVPFRYEAEGTFGEKNVRGTVGVSWLFRAAELRISLKKPGKTGIRLRLLWFYPGAGKKKKRKAAGNGKISGKEKTSRNGEASGHGKVSGKEKTSGNTVIKQKDSEGHQKYGKAAADGMARQVRTVRDPFLEEDQKRLDEAVREGGSGSENHREHAKRKTTHLHKKMTAEKPPRTKTKSAGMTEAGTAEGTSGEKADESRGGKLKILLETFRDPDMRRPLRKVKKAVLGILRHILWREGNLSVEFGFEDPALTGNILAFLAPLYPLFRGKLVLTPYFDRRVFAGAGSCRGLVRPAVLVFYMLPLILDRKLRTTVKKVLGEGNEGK